MPLENAPAGSPGFGRNVRTEMKAGKPQRQAVAIAYSKAGEHRAHDRARPSRRRFRDALRRGLSLDAAFGYAEAEEAARAGQGNPLDSRLVKQCIRDEAGVGGTVHDVLKRAVDRRISFRGSQDSIHPDFNKVKHIASVQEALRDYKSKYAKGGSELKDAENRLNREIERANSPKGSRDGVGGAIVTGIKAAGELAEGASGTVESARGMRHPQGQDAATDVTRNGATPDHECSPQNCYPGCGHLCMQGRGVLEGLRRRRGLVDGTTGLAADALDCPPGEGEVGTPSYAWKSSNNTTAAADRRRRVRDELFAAQPGGRTERLLLGDRGKTDDLMVTGDRATLDALVNRIKGRRLGNLRRPLQRDDMGDTMGEGSSMTTGEVEDGVTPSGASKTAWAATSHADTTATPESHQNAFRAHKTAAGLHETAGNAKKVGLHTNAMNYHRNNLALRGSSVDNYRATKATMGNPQDGAAFEHVERSVAAKGAHDPKALAAWIGRRAEGKGTFQRKAAAGRRRAHDELPSVETPSSSSGPKTITMPSSGSSSGSSPAGGYNAGQEMENLATTLNMAPT